MYICTHNTCVCRCTSITQLLIYLSRLDGNVSQQMRPLGNVWEAGYGNVPGKSKESIKFRELKPVQLCLICFRIVRRVVVGYKQENNKKNEANIWKGNNFLLCMKVCLCMFNCLFSIGRELSAGRILILSFLWPITIFVCLFGLVCKYLSFLICIKALKLYQRLFCYQSVIIKSWQLTA